MAKEFVGGQAVMEGVMMRFRDWLSIAIRTPKGNIVVKTQKWWTLGKRWQKLKFIRGFFVLLETLVNGIKALNYSAKVAFEEESGEELSPGAILLSMSLAIGFAVLLFVILPHLLSFLLNKIGMAGNLHSLSFHLWDGLFKLILFLGYILAISLIPDIKRVFEYHGAEHKTIYAFENSLELTYDNIKQFSRLHPRCGTSFLLFVLAISVFIFAFIIPIFLNLFNFQNTWLRHLFTLILKIILMIPISGIAYEVIKLAGQKEHTWWCKVLCLPGLFFQFITTKEPDGKQIEVAVAALKGALEKGNYAS
ncbi:DUF1385 domain-containing protein [Desulfonauticus submarinus]